MSENNDWIKIRSNKKRDGVPWELKIDMKGNVYVDGEPYDAANSKYKNLSIDVEQHNKISSGEETQKIIESSKKAEKGKTITIKDKESPDRKETTTVKF
ncbi:hypothetical protein [Anaerosalibacter massiliensis]|uniref:Uncharacterized protein n=1 Tax=Anaerosalibacter massiliensis TaxID=1347392 RepID=A0A9X2MFX4_9FIRM|nr:hypothetical protein [Anaerosalibacter massiliensis]MCR2042851.1 hypothetical protein [Anaerosalibacter massiliensis]